MSWDNIIYLAPVYQTHIVLIMISRSHQIIKKWLSLENIKIKLCELGEAESIRVKSCQIEPLPSLMHALRIHNYEFLGCALKARII